MVSRNASWVQRWVARFDSAHADVRQGATRHQRRAAAIFGLNRLHLQQVFDKITGVIGTGSPQYLFARMPAGSPPPSAGRTSAPGASHGAPRRAGGRSGAPPGTPQKSGGKNRTAPGRALPAGRSPGGRAPGSVQTDHRLPVR